MLERSKGNDFQSNAVDGNWHFVCRRWCILCQLSSRVWLVSSSRMSHASTCTRRFTYLLVLPSCEKQITDAPGSCSTDDAIVKSRQDYFRFGRAALVWKSAGRRSILIGALPPWHVAHPSGRFQHYESPTRRRITHFAQIHLFPDFSLGLY